MDLLNLKTNDLKELEIIGEGDESIVYLYNGKIIKIYKNPCEHDYKKIRYLNKIQPNIEKTKFADGILTIDGNFSGFTSSYFENYYDMQILDYSTHISQILYYYKLLLESIKELTDNNIYPVDLFYENVLLKFINRDIKIIDLERNGSVVKQNPNDKLLTKVLNLYTFMLIESLYYKDVNSKDYINYKNLIQKYPFKKEFVDIIEKNHFSYEFLYELLDYIEKDSKKLFKNYPILLKKH